LDLTGPPWLTVFAYSRGSFVGKRKVDLLALSFSLLGKAPMLRSDAMRSSLGVAESAPLRDP
jgi:hypothetical protein